MKLEAKQRLAQTEVSASVPASRIAALKAKGYKVEDISKTAEADEYPGKWRWTSQNMRKRHPVRGEPVDSEAEAWDDADQYEKENP